MSLDLVLDHIGLGVRDLERGRTAFAGLGFRLTRRSVHRGARTPDGPIVPWGSANHCAMFGDGYLEVIGPSTPDAAGPIRDMVERREGAHIIAIGCHDVVAVHATLTARGLPVEAPRRLERDAPVGFEGDETRPVAFRNAGFGPATFDLARLQYTEHLTREVMWQSELLDHPNGVTALSDVYLYDPDSEGLARKLAPMLATIPKPAHPGAWRLGLGRGTVWVVDGAAWARTAPDAAVPAVAMPVGVGFRVASIENTRAYFKGKGTASAGDGRLAVGAHAACGAVLFFDAA